MGLTRNRVPQISKPEDVNVVNKIEQDYDFHDKMVSFTLMNRYFPKTFFVSRVVLIFS